MQTITLTAPDISCEHCKHAIESSVGALPGVQTCAVDIEGKHVQVTYDPATLSRDTIVDTLDEEGYPVGA